MTSPSQDYRTIVEAVGKKHWFYDLCACGKIKTKTSTQCNACRYPERADITQPEDLSIRHVPLTRGYFAVVSSSVYERVMQFKWHPLFLRRPDRSIKKIYAARNLKAENGKNTGQLLHRFIMEIADPKVQVDHWDGDGLNCRDGNLRVATNQQNTFNTPKRTSNKSGYKGVSWCVQQQMWQSSIKVNAKSKHLGYFAERIPAAKAYDAEAMIVFGEFARLNFP